MNIAQPTQARNASLNDKFPIQLVADDGNLSIPCFPVLAAPNETASAGICRY
jgi:hypothetical protein